VFAFSVYTLLNKALVGDETPIRKRNRPRGVPDLAGLSQFDLHRDAEPRLINEARQRVEQARFEPDNGICQLPQLEFEGMHTDTLPVRACRTRINWGHIDRDTHLWHFNKKVLAVLESFDCEKRRVIRVDDFSVNYTKYERLSEGDRILHDVIEVKCAGSAKANKRWLAPGLGRKARFETFIPQIIPEKSAAIANTEIKKNHGDRVATCEPMNIILMSYDSVSRVSWINRLRKTYY
jgi:hypothetical protein